MEPQIFDPTNKEYIQELQQKVAFLEKELSTYKSKYRDAIDNNEYKAKYRELVDTYHNDYREKQQDLTELNGDGNRERGRYGEDLRSGSAIKEEHPNCGTPDCCGQCDTASTG